MKRFANKSRKQVYKEQKQTYKIKRKKDHG